MTRGLTLTSTKEGEEDDYKVEDTKYDKGEKGDSRVSHYSIIISVCRLRERGRTSKSVHVHVVRDLELLCSSLCD